MSNVAFLGLGQMGARMCKHLLDAGHCVSVWNRSAAKAESLIQSGAILAHSPRLAVAQADVVFSMVRDDNASTNVWLDESLGALAGMKADALAVECSTVSVHHFSALSRAFEAEGRQIIGAPVAGSLPQAEQQKLIFLVGATAAQLDIARPLFLAMGGAIHHVGLGGSGVVLKLMVNTLLGVQVSLLAELLGFCEKLDLSPVAAIDILSQIPVVSPALAQAAQGMLAKSFAPNFPIDLVKKDFNLLLADAEKVNADMPIAKNTRAVFDACSDRGFAGDNITGVYKLYL